MSERKPQLHHGLEERLAASSDWVQRAFQRLDNVCHSLCLGVETREATRAEGRMYYCAGQKRPFCRIDPKIDHIGIGFTNEIRDDVHHARCLRQNRKDKAWIFLTEDAKIDMVIGLIGMSIKAAQRR